MREKQHLVSHPIYMKCWCLFMEIPEPLVKRTFSGGPYAAHVLRAWDFEETLNFYNYTQSGAIKDLQLDIISN